MKLLRELLSEAPGDTKDKIPFRHKSPTKPLKPSEHRDEKEIRLLNKEMKTLLAEPNGERIHLVRLGKIRARMKFLDMNETKPFDRASNLKRRTKKDDTETR